MANENRLIDANALKSQITRYHMSLTPRYISKLVDAEIGDVIDIIDEAPTVDAVEVVRCKKCKHWLHMEDGMGDCTNSRFHLPGHADPTMKADDFCSCGERREGKC